MIWCCSNNGNWDPKISCYFPLIWSQIFLLYLTPTIFKPMNHLDRVFLRKLLLCLSMSFLAHVSQVGAQIVKKTKYKSEAHKVIYVTQYKSEADMIVYETKYKSEAKPYSGIWCWTKYASEANWLVYFTRYKSEADLVIYFTKYKSEAGMQ